MGTVCGKPIPQIRKGRAVNVTTMAGLGGSRRCIMDMYTYIYTYLNMYTAYIYTYIHWICNVQSQPWLTSQEDSQFGVTIPSYENQQPLLISSSSPSLWSLFLSKRIKWQKEKARRSLFIPTLFETSPPPSSTNAAAFFFGTEGRFPQKPRRTGMRFNFAAMMPPRMAVATCPTIHGCCLVRLFSAKQ